MFVTILARSNAMRSERKRLTAVPAPAREKNARTVSSQKNKEMRKAA
jgi:hypothetical protein